MRYRNISSILTGHLCLVCRLAVPRWETYRELIRLHTQEGLSFRNVITFNMDEYIGLKEDHPQSYHYFMQEHLFSHIDIRKENVHLPDGNAGDIPAMCAAYEESIADAGGIDLFLGGVGGRWPLSPSTNRSVPLSRSPG